MRSLLTPAKAGGDPVGFCGRHGGIRVDIMSFDVLGSGLSRLFCPGGGRPSVYTCIAWCLLQSHVQRRPVLYRARVC